MRTGIGRVSSPGSLANPVVSIIWLRWNSSISGCSDSKGSPILASSEAPLSWSA